jgi:hypothetical protein
VRRRLRGLWRWAAAHQFLAALALIGALVAAAFWRDSYLDAEQDRRVECIGEWGDAVSSRSAALIRAGNTRSDALDLILRDVADQITTGRQDRAAFRAKLSDYVAASDEYRRKQAENPVPDPPRIRC